MPSRTPSQGAHSNDLLHQLGLAAPWHGTVGVSLHQGDGQHSSGGDRQQPVGHGAGDVSTPVPGTIVNNQQLDGLGDISARSLGLFEFQAASTPMVRQQVRNMYAVHVRLKIEPIQLQKVVFVSFRVL